MSFKLETTDMDLGDTPIENIFINDFMPLANGTHVKVYILGYKYAKDKEEGLNVTNQLISKHLQISLEDVLEAWDFWEELGIIEKLESKSTDPFDKKYNYGIKFLSLRQLYIKNNFNILKEEKKENQAATDIDVLEMNKNPEINQLFNEIDYIIRRPSQIGEKRKIIDWINQFNMNPEVIELAFNLAAENEKVPRSQLFNYVNGTIRNWYDDGLTNIDKVVGVLEKRDDRIGIYSLILKSLGQYRLPTSGEKEIINKWIDEMDFNEEIILEATKRTTSAVNPTINYVDGILRNWAKENIQNIEDVEAVEKERKIKKEKPVTRKKADNFQHAQTHTKNYTEAELENLAYKKRQGYLDILKGDNNDK